MKTSQNISKLREQLVQLLFRLGQQLYLISELERDEEKIKQMENKLQIPPEYEQRFMLEPLQAPDQVKGRHKTLEMLTKAYENHEPTLVEGEPGCGMTSFLNAGLALFENTCILADDHRIYQVEELVEELSQALGMEKVREVNTFVENLPDEPKRVVIFESIERLFLRKIHGFDLIETFLFLIQQTKDKIFWIITGNRYPLDLLDRVLHYREQFPNHMVLRHFDSNSTEESAEGEKEGHAKKRSPLETVLSFFRTNAKGREAEKEAEIKLKRRHDEEFIEQTLESLNHDYQNKFFKPAVLPAKLERALTRAGEKKKQQLLRDHFFEKLHAFADGHISRALLFWLNSIVGVRKKNEEKEMSVVWLKPFEPRDPASITRPEEWFALEAIFQHNSLSVSDLSEVIRYPRNQCRLIINKLLEEGWLYKRKPRNGIQEYQINLLYTTELQGLLKDELTRKSV